MAAGSSARRRQCLRDGGTREAVAIEEKRAVKRESLKKRMLTCQR